MDLDAENFLGRWALVEALAMPGRYEEALVAVEPALMMSGRHPWALSALAGIHAARGAYDAAHAVYHELTSRGKTGYIESASQAAAAAGCGSHGGSAVTCRGACRTAGDLPAVLASVPRLGSVQV